MYDLIVIGGGPAALSATFYALGKKLNVVMVCEELGGKVGWLQSIAGPDGEQYLPGNELVQNLTSRIVAQERIVLDRVTRVGRADIDFVVETQRHGTMRSAALIIATGAAPLKLNVPGASKVVGHGIGYSITTYAHLVAGERVAVVGASPRALSGAAELARTVEQLYLIVPDPRRLTSVLAAALREHPRVEMLKGYEVVEVIGGEAIEALRVTRGEESRVITVDRAFVDLGLVPNSHFVRKLVQTDEEGYIVVNDWMETTQAGMFAAGDVTIGWGEQVLVAIGDGARAAMSAYDYLQGQWLLSYQVQSTKDRAST